MQRDAMRTRARVRFCGLIDEIAERVRYARMTSEHGVTEVLREAEEPFFTRNDDIQAPIGLWRGEFWGKLMLSAAAMYKYSGDGKLPEIIRESAYRIIQSRDENGYIGTYKDRHLILPCPTDIGMKLVGWKCYFCWNIWCQKYTLWGFIEAYDILRDPELLNTARGIADGIIESVEKVGVGVCETGTFFGVASGSILKPFCLLYQKTEDNRYLEFARKIASEFEDETTRCAKLITNALAGKPIREWNYGALPDEDAYTSNKAYEMMSCYEGLLELYRLTEEERYLRATEAFFELAVKDEYNALCSVGYNDRFLGAAALRDASTEPCDVVHFMRLAAELYLITGKIGYIEYFERALLNPYLASFTRDGYWGARAVRSASHPVVDSKVVDMKYNQCCVNNLPRGFLSASDLAITEGEGGVYLNLLTPSRAETKDFSISVGDGYLRYGTLELSVAARKPLLLNIRIPATANDPTVTLDGKVYEAKANSYFGTELDTGTHIVRLEFNPKPLVTEHCQTMSMTPFLRSRYEMGMPSPMTESDKVTVSYGPVLLSMSKQLGTSFKDMISRGSIHGTGGSLTLDAVPDEKYLCRFNATIKVGDEYEIIPLCDFATAASRFTEGDYCIFI